MADKPRPMKGSALTSTPPSNPSFLPRSEFWQSPIIPHDFALLSFNGNEILRLANCPENVVHAVRRAFPPDDVRYFREDTELGVCEFLLAGKPFAGRSAKQEQILLNIFSAVLSQSYQLVTTIDYGRIYLDKLTLAFSRDLSIEDDSLHKRARLETFGISFVSSTSLRVVAPPLSHTPAILKVVRSAWPLGVTNEKRESDGSYMFKLKGYSFFKQSTFETDSLTHTLELLRGMDSHGFKLISSVCLAKRSRVQDFWIFGVPAPPLPPISVAANDSLATKPALNGSPVQSHSMLGLSPPASATTPVSRGPSRSKAPGAPSPSRPAQNLSPPSSHARSASNPYNGPKQSSHMRMSSLPGTTNHLRKSPPGSKPGTPVKGAIVGARSGNTPTPDHTPRPSPRENPRNLQPSPSRFGPQYQPQYAYPNHNQPSTSSNRPPYNHTNTGNSSAQLLYMASPPQPGNDALYHTVPSGVFQAPNPTNGSPYPPHPPTQSDKLLGSSVFRDTAYTRDSLSSVDTATAYNSHSNLGPFVLSENDARREGEHRMAAQERSPKVVHPDLEYDHNDPARRASDLPSFGYLPPHYNGQFDYGDSPVDSLNLLGLGLGGLVNDFDEGHGNSRWMNAPESVRSEMGRSTAYETAPGSPMNPKDRELEDDYDEDSEEGGADTETTDGLSTLADKARVTTIAAAAEVVSYSNKLHPATTTPPATGPTTEAKRKSTGGTEIIVSPLSAESDNSTKKDGPWVLVSDALSPTASTTQPQPAAVPIPIPSDGDQSAFLKHSRKGSFPWSKSRREAKEKVKAMDKQHEREKKATKNGTSSMREPVTSSAPTHQVVETIIPEITEVHPAESHRPDPKPSLSSLKVEVGSESGTTNSSSSGSSSSDSTTTTSSSSPVATPTVNTAALPEVGNGSGERSQTERPPSTKEKGKGGGIFGRKRANIAEVGTADRRLTID